MTLLSDRTARKYRGKMASGYEAKRMKQLRWHQENAIVRGMLEGARGSVLDVPVGTGRFLAMYNELGLHPVVGIDSSDEMLKLAARKGFPYELENGDARKLRFADRSFDNVVCVRFLDLIDEPAMTAVVTELLRVASSRVIATVRFGPAYILKSNTATHDEVKFKALISQLGWQITEAVLIFDAGWHVLKMEKRTTEAKSPAPDQSPSNHLLHWIEEREARQRPINVPGPVTKIAMNSVSVATATALASSSAKRFPAVSLPNLSSSSVRMRICGARRSRPLKLTSALADFSNTVSQGEDLPSITAPSDLMCS